MNGSDDEADRIEFSLCDMPVLFLERIIHMLVKMHRVSFLIAILLDKRYSRLVHVFETIWFEPNETYEDRELAREIGETLKRTPYYVEVVPRKLRCSDFICDYLSEIAHYVHIDHPKICSRRLKPKPTEQADAEEIVNSGEKPHCLSLIMHALHAESILDSRSGRSFPCFNCMKRVDKSYAYLENYTDARVLYCEQCLVKKRSPLIVAERTLEEQHGIPRKLLRQHFQFHAFPLSVSPNQVGLSSIILDCENGPIVTFKRELLHRHPQHFYYVGDIARIKKDMGADGLVSEDTLVKRVRKRPEVQAGIAALRGVLQQHDFTIKRLSIGPTSSAKRSKQ